MKTREEKQEDARRELEHVLKNNPCSWMGTLLGFKSPKQYEKECYEFYRHRLGEIEVAESHRGEYGYEMGEAQPYAVSLES